MSLVGYSLWGCRELDTTERLSLTLGGKTSPTAAFAVIARPTEVPFAGGDGSGVGTGGRVRHPSILPKHAARPWAPGHVVGTGPQRGLSPGLSPARDGHSAPRIQTGAGFSTTAADRDSHGLPAVDVFPQQLLRQLRELHRGLLVELGHLAVQLAVCKEARVAVRGRSRCPSGPTGLTL